MDAKGSGDGLHAVAEGGDEAGQWLPRAKLMGAEGSGVGCQGVGRGVGGDVGGGGSQGGPMGAARLGELARAFAKGRHEQWGKEVTGAMNAA
jgi:hypothetical protein